MLTDSQEFLHFCRQQAVYLASEADELDLIADRQSNLVEVAYAAGAAAALRALGRAFADAIPVEQREYDFTADDLYEQVTS